MQVLLLNPTMYRNEKNNFYEYLKIFLFMTWLRERKTSWRVLKSCWLAGLWRYKHTLLQRCHTELQTVCPCVCVCVCVCVLSTLCHTHTHTDFSGHICIFAGGLQRDRMLTPPAIIPQVSPLRRRVVSTSRRCTSSPPCCASPAYCPQSRSCRTASRTGAGSSLWLWAETEITWDAVKKLEHLDREHF